MSTESPSAGAHILVVEDSVDQAFLLRSVLEARGFRVRTAQDGQSALEMWDAGEFDAVVTDLNLPGMNGVELARALKAAGRKAFVIAVTGYTDESYAAAARRAGVTHVLLKPFDPDELIGLLESRPDEPEPDDAGVSTALVFAARPGDAVFGCGGTMLRHLRDGHHVVVHAADPELDEAAAACVRTAADVLGVEVRFADAATSIEAVVEEVAPDIAYIPSATDDHAARRALHMAAASALSRVPALLGYLTPTSTLEFRPDSLKIVTPQMSAKLDAILAFADLRDPALTGRFVQATACWWGRRSGFAEVEPFERILW